MDITFKFNKRNAAERPSVLAGNRPDRFVAARKMAVNCGQLCAHRQARRQ
ncbi:MAG: hypothetical protein R2838_09555 [Caldilineaceae bacterium]